MIKDFFNICCCIFFFTNAIAADSSQEVVSPHSIDAWNQALNKADLKGFTNLLYAAQKEYFPSTANNIAVKVVYENSNLSELQKKTANIPEFKVEAALYLALANRSNVIQVDKLKMRKIIIAYIGTGGRVESKALSVLAHLQDPRDVKLLGKVANSDNQNRYRPAIYGLRVMCLPEADRALDELKMISKDKNKIEFINESVNLSQICKK